jgi:hypothetical protein
MGGGSTNTPSDGLKSLLDINHQATFNGRNVNPFSILIQDLQSASVVLGKKGKKTRRVFVGANTLRVRCRLRILDKFQSAHSAFKIVKGVDWQGQTLRHEMDKTLGKPINLGNVFINQRLRARVIRILYCQSIDELAENYPKLRLETRENSPGLGPQDVARMDLDPSNPSFQGFQNHIAGRFSLPNW